MCRYTRYQTYFFFAFFSCCLYLLGMQPASAAENIRIDNQLSQPIHIEQVPIDPNTMLPELQELAIEGQSHFSINWGNMTGYVMLIITDTLHRILCKVVGHPTAGGMDDVMVFNIHPERLCRAYNHSVVVGKQTRKMTHGGGLGSSASSAMAEPISFHLNNQTDSDFKLVAIQQNYMRVKSLYDLSLHDFHRGKEGQIRLPLNDIYSSGVHTVELAVMRQIKDSSNSAGSHNQQSQKEQKKNQWSQNPSKQNKESKNQDPKPAKSTHFAIDPIAKKQEMVCILILEQSPYGRDNPSLADGPRAQELIWQDFIKVDKGNYRCRLSYDAQHEVHLDLQMVN